MLSQVWLCAVAYICASFPVVPFGNNGCNGGDTYNVFEYIIGVDTASYYSYKAQVSVANRKNVYNTSVNVIRFHGKMNKVRITTSVQKQTRI